MPVGRLQPEGGLLFVWVINAKWQFTMDLFEHWGYKCAMPLSCRLLHAEQILPLNRSRNVI